MSKGFKILMTSLSFFVIFYILFVVFYSENNPITKGVQLLVAGIILFFSVLISYLLYSRNVATEVNDNLENKKMRTTKNSLFWISVTPLLLFVSFVVYVLFNWRPY